MTSLPTILRAVRHRLGPARLPFSGLDPEAITTNHADVNAAVRWIDPVTIEGATREAYLCHPDSTIAFRLDAPSRSRVVAWCALRPECWSSHTGASGLPWPWMTAVRIARDRWSSIRRGACAIDDGAA